jgi:hypothetical protein
MKYTKWRLNDSIARGYTEAATARSTRSCAACWPSAARRTLRRRLARSPPQAVESFRRHSVYICMDNHERNILSGVRMTLPPMASAAARATAARAARARHKRLRFGAGGLPHLPDPGCRGGGRAALGFRRGAQALERGPRLERYRPQTE